MPNFASALTEPLNGRKLTDEELVRAVRFLVSAEYEAVQMYQQIVEATDNKLAIKVINSVIDEEKVHAGEFLKLLRELDPEEAKHYEEGEKEVEDEKKTTNEDLEIGESVERVMRLIDEKTVTADDFNQFIVETSPTSINKRVQRQMKHDRIGPQVSHLGRQVDDITDHEPADHNDPTTTLRGKHALRKRIKHNKAHPNQFREAVEFLRVNSEKPLSECKTKLCDVVDQVSLHKLVTRLLQQPSQFDHDWLIGLDDLMSNYVYGKTHV